MSETWTGNLQQISGQTYSLKYSSLGFFRLDYLGFYVTFNLQGHIPKGRLQVEETSAYYTVNHRALASNYQLSNMKLPAKDSNQWPQRLEARTLPLHHRAPIELL